MKVGGGGAGVCWRPRDPCQLDCCTGTDRGTEEGGLMDTLNTLLPGLAAG